MSDLECRRCHNHFFRLATRTRGDEAVVTAVCADCGAEVSDVPLSAIHERPLMRTLGY